MTEWWSYRLEDFLMFSPRVYARLFEQVNTAWWPLPPLLMVAGAVALVALWRGRGLAWIGAALGAAWVFCSLVFLHGLFEPINWAVAGLWPLLLALGVVLPVLGGLVRHHPPPGGWPRGMALGLAAWALLLHPLLAPLAGRGWPQAEWLALAPDPTAVATLAWLAALPRAHSRGARALVVLAWLPVLAWCGFSTLMLWAMDDPRALVLPLAVALALGARAASRVSGMT